MRLSCMILAMSVAMLSVGADSDTEDLIVAGDFWRYFKGNQAPPASWHTAGYNDSGWLWGPTGIGYGDGDDATVLDDMRNNYLSVFMRRSFEVTTPAAVVGLSFSVVYDDGFAAYLNGHEVARENLPSPAAYDTPAINGSEPTSALIDLTNYRDRLVAGENVLAIQAHNVTLGSSDLSMIPALTAALIPNATPFVRGDVNNDGTVNVSDAFAALAYLFDDGPVPPCPIAADVNDDGRLNLIDPVHLLANLFVAGPPIPAPTSCGLDTTWDRDNALFSECTYTHCP